MTTNQAPHTIGRLPGLGDSYTRVGGLTPLDNKRWAVDLERLNTSPPASRRTSSIPKSHPGLRYQSANHPVLHSSTPSSSTDVVAEEKDGSPEG